MYLIEHSTITGDFSKGATPVLIPNTEVKTLSAEHTCLETSREHRSLPVFPKWLPSGSLFFAKTGMTMFKTSFLRDNNLAPALLAGNMRQNIRCSL